MLTPGGRPAKVIAVDAKSGEVLVQWGDHERAHFNPRHLQHASALAIAASPWGVTQ